MEANELRHKTREELTRSKAELEAMIRDLRFKAATRQLNKVRDLRKAKHDLARVATALNALPTT